MYLYVPNNVHHICVADVHYSSHDCNKPCSYDPKAKTRVPNNEFSTELSFVVHWLVCPDELCVLYVCKKLRDHWA